MPRRSLLWPDPRVKPPYGSVALDRAHSLGAKAFAYFALNEGAGFPTNLVRPTPVTLIDTQVALTWAGAWAEAIKANTQQWAAQQLPVVTGTVGASTAYSAVIRVRIPSASENGCALKIGDISDPVSNGIGLGVGSGNFATAGNDLIGLHENLAWLPTGVAIGTGWHTLGLSEPVNSGSQKYYLDGRLVFTGSHAGFNAVGTDMVGIGGYPKDGRFWQGGIDWVYLAQSQLTDAEMFQLAVEPYAFLRPILRRRYSVPAAAGITGTLAATLDAVTLVATATLGIAGTVAATLAPVTLVATGVLGITGQVATTLDPVTLVATGSSSVTGTLAATLDPVTLVATGALPIAGAVARTLDPVTLVSTGTGPAPILGVAAITLDPVTLAATGTLALRGAVARTLDPVTLVATATMPAVGFTPILTADEIMQIAYRRTDRDPGWQSPRPPRPVEDHVPKLAGPDPGPWPYPPEDFWEAR